MLTKKAVYMIKSSSLILLGAYLRFRSENKILENVMKAYAYLWKGKREIVAKHLIIDSINDAFFSYTFGLWLGLREKDVKIQHSCASPLCKDNIIMPISNGYCGISTVSSKKYKSSKLKIKAKPSITYDVANKVIHMASEFIHEFYYHAKIKSIAILAYPLVYAMKEEVKDIYHNNVKCKESDLVIENIYEATKMVATYVAINPYEGIFLGDSFLTNEDEIVKYVTESEVDTRQSDKEYSRFMSEFNEDWMEGIVDSYIHLGDYYTTIANNWHLPTVSYKIAGWAALMVGLKYNTDQKQAMLEGLYNKESVKDESEQNYSSLDTYINQDVCINYVGEEFCKSEMVL